MTETIDAALDAAAVQGLRETVRGRILGPGDDDYAEASRIWNGMHDGRRPALVVRCTGAADVIAALDFARRNSLLVAVRGGGHGVAGFSTCDGGIVVDLSPLRSVRVDPAARRAFVGGGATWGDVDHETQAHGLATTGGLVSTTGVGGFTLGGGIGWLTRKHGLACDNLLAADVVTADGRLVHATENENAGLLCGLRGGGGNFGVVTQFELALHPLGPIVYAGPIFLAPADARELLRLYREWAQNASDDVTALASLTTAPPLPAIPEEWHGRQVALLTALSAGPVEDGESHFTELRTTFDPVADLLGPMRYTVLQSLVDPVWPKGIQSYFKSANLSWLDDGLIDRLCELHLEAPGPLCEVHFHQMGGAVARVPEGETAFAERSMPFVLNAVAGWWGPEAADAHVEWARRVIETASEAATGRAYVNFLGDAGAARSAYGAETYTRLVALKNEYDPTNLFRLNQNVEPTAT